jgi:hypothetical protein
VLWFSDLVVSSSAVEDASQPYHMMMDTVVLHKGRFLSWELVRSCVGGQKDRCGSVCS